MEEFVQTIQQQPKPLPLKRPHASFLEDTVDLLPSNPASKRYRPESVDAFVIQWVNSASSSGSGLESYRERHCRSDTLLVYSDGNIIPRRRTRSAPNMESRRDTDGFALPSTPASAKSCPCGADAEDGSHLAGYGPLFAPSDISGTTAGSGRKSLVENPLYRDTNLAMNNIYMRSSREQFPAHIANLVDNIRLDRNSPDPSLDQVWQDLDLENLELGAPQPEVEDYFKVNIFGKPKIIDILKRIDRNPMVKNAVPDVGSKLKVSTPVPDMIFGYNRNEAFAQQQTQLLSMGNEMVANTQDVLYPFFVIEFKADGPGVSGSMWVATNQCLGGSTSCVSIAERLNQRLRQCKNEEILPIDSAAFSIAMNGTEARLYVSWKHDELKYYMRKVDSFLLQRPKDYMEFRKHVLNIMDWGKDVRLKEIQTSLDSLLEEENRKLASQHAKSRPPPFVR
ncbi:MAG: hypothetical protein M1825_004512 [Sarcosagium campestre]|nr:MAG: hypothetical protein M1825_004512 [Sarcosagium campestre]